MDVLVTSVFLYLIIAVLGVCLGSFLNSWMWRVQGKKWRVGGRSVCVHCQRRLNWYENIPLISFLVLRGRCRTCQRAIPGSYFWVELSMCLLLVWLTWYHTWIGFNPWQYFRDICMVSVLVVTFVYDFKYMTVLSGVTWAAALAGFLFNVLFLKMSVPSLLLGMVCGGGFFLVQYVMSRGRWVGGGDVRLGVMMGAWLGFPVVFVALLISYVLGALVAIPLLFSRRKQASSQIPFGTFLAIGTGYALWFGPISIAWYINLFSW